MSFRNTSLALAAALALSAAPAFAQTAPNPPPARPPAALSAGTPQTTTGTVQQWLVNPNGEVDGLLLNDGTQVSVSPRLSAALLKAVKLRDKVEVVGQRNANQPVVRAASIKNVASGRSVAETPRDPGATPPRPPRDGSSLTAMNASGRITRVLYGPRGEANGALLDGGTIVRFPPHAGAALGSQLVDGGTLYARGYGTRNDVGSALEATTLGPTLETATDTFRPPKDGPGRRDAGGPGGRPGPHGRHAPHDGPGAPPAPGGAMTSPPPPHTMPGGPDAPRPPARRGAAQPAASASAAPDAPPVAR